MLIQSVSLCGCVRYLQGKHVIVLCQFQLSITVTHGNGDMVQNIIQVVQSHILNHIFSLTVHSTEHTGGDTTLLQHPLGQTQIAAVVRVMLPLYFM